MTLSVYRGPRVDSSEGFTMRFARPLSNRNPQAQARPYRTRLQVECLEDRVVPSHVAIPTGPSDWKAAALDSTAGIAHVAPRHGTGGPTLLSAVNEAEPPGSTGQNDM